MFINTFELVPQKEFPWSKIPIKINSFDILSIQKTNLDGIYEIMTSIKTKNTCNNIGRYICFKYINFTNKTIKELKKEDSIIFETFNDIIKDFKFKSE